MPEGSLGALPGDAPPSHQAVCVLGSRGTTSFGALWQYLLEATPMDFRVSKGGPGV